MKPIIKDDRLSGKKVLITGGTGFIGRALCRTLVASKCEVVVLTRNASHSKGKIDNGVVLINSLNLLKEDDAFDIIINLAGEPIAQRWTKSAKEKIVASRINTTTNIVHFIRNSRKKPSVFISGSAVGYYGIDDSKPFNETMTPAEGNGGIFAKKVCLQWEKAAAAAKECGVRTIFLRIGAVLEKDGGTLSKLFLPFYFCLGGRIGNGKQWFSWIHRDDLIGIMLHIISTPSLEGAVNGTAAQPVTNDTFTKALARAMKRPAFFPMPAFILRMVFGEMPDEIMLNGQKVMPEKVTASGYSFLYPDIDKALQAVFG